MKKFLIPLFLFFATVANAQKADTTGVSAYVDSVWVKRSEIDRFEGKLNPDSSYAFCVPFFHHEGQNTFIDSIAPVPDGSAINPHCSPPEAVLLVRPLCAIALTEFLVLRERTPYIGLFCKAGRIGMRLRDGVPPKKV